MKKIYMILVALSLMAVGGMMFRAEIADAAGHIGISNVRNYLRTNVETYTIGIPAADADIASGISAVLNSQSVNGLSVEADVAWTSTISRPPYPCRLLVDMVDASANGTVACTGDVVICGLNQFGSPVDAVDGCETIATTISEAGVSSAYVYESVASVSVTDLTCSGAADAGDHFRVACQPEIGLQFPLSTYTGIISLCVADASASYLLNCWDGAELSDDWDQGDSSINVAGVASEDPDITLADGDIVYIRYRAPSGK